MSIEINFNFDGYEDIEVMLTQSGERASRGIYTAMRSEAESIAALARRMAPLEYGYLEKAIKIQETKGQRDALGRFMRGEISVYVDTDAAAHHGVTGEYAYIMHEHLSYGGYSGALKLGKLSQRKQAADTSVVVGGKYMERAADEREAAVYAKANQAVQQVF